MSSIVLMAGIGIFSFLLLYMFYILKDNKQQELFKFFLLLTALGVLILIPKAAIDDQTTCEIVLNDTQEIYRYGDNYSSYHWDYTSPLPSVSDVNLFHRNTTYNYDTYCYTKAGNTPTIFNRAVAVFYWISMTYIFIFISWMVLKYLFESFGMRMSKDEEE